MKKLDFSGVFAVMLTPFDASGEINMDTVGKLVDFYCDTGVDGIFPCGSAGEAIHLNNEQKSSLIRFVAERSNGRVQVIPGAIATNIKDALEIASVAREAGCDGLVVTPPYYYKFEPAYIRQYFDTILAESGLPIVLYNIPAYAQPLDPTMFEELAKNPMVAGVKDSSGSMVDFLHYLNGAQKSGRKIGVMSGREEMLFASLAVGGSGSMSAINAVLPEVMTQIRDQFRSGNLSEANKLQMSIFELVTLLYSVQLPIAFREALTMRGYEMGPAVHDIPPSQVKSTEATFKNVKHELDAVLQAFANEYGSIN